MVRRIGSAVLTLTVAAGVTLATAAPASAATNKFAVPSGTGCLDGYNEHRPTELYTTGCNTGSFQRWGWGGVFNSRTQLRSSAVTSHCIQQDIENTAVSLEPCVNGRSTQAWLVQGRPGSLVIRSAAAPELCLTRAAENVDMAPCTSGRPAAWVLR
ncbi:ricin-type beta-trefoil lectin domain protein [Amycolatopsis sp. YIM 10]|uniref:ricin-type beta-trefoil lectin domain protein n=1 Tax=Amycolatopsis sp. YIM 10 TaxID=2653857 RepID=UPI0012A9319B|nr:ricin-type beta-trefoil lectin domain protein [Amycolatopsis sp. YIM 10]QFU86784.1 Ricin-type beta-trefoil lectin domain protein [Amycolatopsis sp. YIM 10]